MLTQVDGSPHDWLEGRGKRLTLIASIDDATNEVPAAVFREQEDAAGYFMVMQEICQKHGLPMAVYADRHTIFQSPKKATIEQQLAGEEPRPGSDLRQSVWASGGRVGDQADTSPFSTGKRPCGAAVRDATGSAGEGPSGG